MLAEATSRPVIGLKGSPSEEEITQARRIVKALEDAEAKGRGAVSLHGRMIDKPVADRARLLLARAGRWAG